MKKKTLLPKIIFYNKGNCVTAFKIIKIKKYNIMDINILPLNYCGSNTQKAGNGRTLKNPDVPRDGYNPIELQDKIPTEYKSKKIKYDTF